MEVQEAGQIPIIDENQANNEEGGPEAQASLQSKDQVYFDENGNPYTSEGYLTEEQYAQY